jgi:hypothetical protein
LQLSLLDLPPAGFIKPAGFLFDAASFAVRRLLFLARPSPGRLG